MKKLIYFAVVLNLFCVDVPEWFEKPQPNLNGFYGLGSGENIPEAKRNAIADLGSVISSNVQSSFSSQTQRAEDALHSSASQNININSDDLKLSNLTIAKSECEDEICYVRVEISKNDLLSQLKGNITLELRELEELSSPFDYAYKRDVLFPRLVRDHSLYSSLGGIDLQIPKSIGSKPTFDLVFEYDGDFSKAFKNILEKTIKDNITKYGKISSKSDWKIIVGVYKEDKSVSIDVTAKHNGEEIHNTSIHDTQKSNISNSFFAKRLGVQTYKKINKWGKQ